MTHTMTTMTYYEYYDNKTYIFTQPGQLGCVAESYDDLKTKIRIGNEVIEGPTIENLVIKSCVCTTVHICN